MHIADFCRQTTKRSIQAFKQVNQITLLFREKQEITPAYICTISVVWYSQHTHTRLQYTKRNPRREVCQQWHKDPTVCKRLCTRQHFNSRNYAQFTVTVYLIVSEYTCKWVRNIVKWFIVCLVTVVLQQVITAGLLHWTQDKTNIAFKDVDM